MTFVIDDERNRNGGAKLDGCAINYGRSGIWTEAIFECWCDATFDQEIADGGSARFDRGSHAVYDQCKVFLLRRIVGGRRGRGHACNDRMGEGRAALGEKRAGAERNEKAE